VLELHRVADITKRPDAVDTSALELVDDDVAAVVELDAGRFDVELFAIGNAPRGDQKCICNYRFAVAKLDDDLVAVFANVGGNLATAQREALAKHLGEAL